MRREEFDRLIEDQLEECKKVLISKATEYDTDDSDRLKDFKQAALLQNGNQMKALAGMVSKQIVSFMNFCSEDSVYTQSKEKWIERITDITNYMLIARAIIEEEFGQLITDSKEDK